MAEEWGRIYWIIKMVEWLSHERQGRTSNSGGASPEKEQRKTMKPGVEETPAWALELG